MSGVIRLGMVRLTDAAPVVHAYASFGFRAAGLDVEVSVEPSWANIADKLAWGVLDGAVMLPPLAIAMTLGLRAPRTKLHIACGISRCGNAVTLAPGLAEAVGRGGVAAVGAAVAARWPLRLAVVHPFSTHDLLLRLLLEQGGLDPAAIGPFANIPPPEMPDALGEARIDGFCAGAPWGGVAEAIGVGRTVALSSAIAPDHPEKCLAVRRDWAQAHPGPLAQLVAVLARAAAHCGDPAHAPALANLLSAPEWVGVAPPLIAASLPGGAGVAVDRSRFSVEVRPEDASWLLSQMSRVRMLPAEAREQVGAMYEASLP